MEFRVKQNSLNEFIKNELISLGGDNKVYQPPSLGRDILLKDTGLLNPNDVLIFEKFDMMANSRKEGLIQEYYNIDKYDDYCLIAKFDKEIVGLVD